MQISKALTLGMGLILAVHLAGCATGPSLPPDLARDFEDYQSKPHYRAFVATRSIGRNAWAASWRWNYGNANAAVESALEGCEERRKQYVSATECHVYAIGDIIVHGMSDDEFEAAMALYQSNRYADNDELQALVLTNPSNGLSNLLSEAEIRSKIIGNTMTGFSTRQGVQWTEFYLQDGTLRGIYDEGKYTASWHLSGSEMCWDYSGAEYDGCSQLSLNGEDVMFYEKGRAAGRARLLEGNPNGL